MAETLNFKVVDGDYLEDYEEEFIRLYNNRRIRTADIPSKLGISESNYRFLYRRLMEEHKLNDRSKNHKKTVRRKPKHYIYEVRRGKRTYFAIKKNEVYYGCYKRREEAKEVVERLKECDWDKKQLQRIRERIKK